MNINKAMILILLVFPIALNAAGSQEYSDRESSVYNIDGFTGIDASGAYDIEVKEANRFSVTIFADKSVRDKLIVEKRGSTLHLGIKPFTFNFKQSPKAIITMPSLESVGLSGATSMIAVGFHSEDSFDCDLSGASSLEIDFIAEDVTIDLSGASDMKAVLEADRVNIEVSGSSDVELVGYGRDLRADLGGASSADLSDFPVTSADVELSGSSDIHINLKGKLNLDASGASDLYYTGDVVLGDIDLSGSSSLKEK